MKRLTENVHTIYVKKIILIVASFTEQEFSRPCDWVLSVTFYLIGNLSSGNVI